MWICGLYSLTAVLLLRGCHAEVLLPILFYSMYSWLINDDDDDDDDDDVFGKSNSKVK